MKRLIRSISLTVLTFVSVVLATILVLVLVAWLFPHWWIDETTVRIASRLLPEVGVNVTWGPGSRIEVNNPSFLRKRFHIQARQFCMGIPSIGFDACTKKLELDTTVHFGFGVRVERIDCFLIQEGRLNLVHPVAARRGLGPVSESESGSESRPRSLGQDLPFGLQSATLGRIEVNLRRLRVHTGAGIIVGNTEWVVKEKGAGVSSLARGGLSWLESGHAMERSESTPIERVRFQVSAELRTRALESLQLAEWSADYSGSFAIPIHWEGTLRGRRAQFVLSSPLSRVKFADGVLVFGSTTNLNLKVDQFEKLVGVLRPTPLAIPSPFNTLKGLIDLSLDYPKKDRLPFTIRTQLQSRNQKLISNVQGTWALGPPSKVEMAATITAGKLALPPLDWKRLPAVFPDSRILLGAEPLRVNDNQLWENTQVLVHLRTESPHALHLIANVAKDPVPVELDLRLHSHLPPSGSIRLGKARLDVLHRQVVLQKAALELKSNADLPPRLVAELSVKYSEYKVFVDIFGSTEKPSIFLTSDPPLSEEDAMSVLLFGQTASQLDSSKTESLAGAQAAIANRAVNLASMYLLATTPIESIGYDPATSILSARLRLRDGTTLQMKGSGLGVSGLGVRQTLGGAWSIRTELERSAGDHEGRSASALLEWSRRY